MGYEEHPQSSSSGVLIAVVVVILFVAMIGIVAVLGAGFFFVSRVEMQEAVIAEELAVAEARRAEAEAVRAIEEARSEATPDPTLIDFEVKLDRDGNASLDGADIDLDGLRARLAKLKEETSDAFSVRIDADSECPVKHVVNVVDLCKGVGVINYSILSSIDSDVSVHEGRVGK
jgi:biopolymer transport protein ExbD